MSWTSRCLCQMPVPEHLPLGDPQIPQSHRPDILIGQPVSACHRRLERDHHQGSMFGKVRQQASRLRTDMPILIHRRIESIHHNTCTQEALLEDDLPPDPRRLVEHRSESS